MAPRGFEAIGIGDWGCLKVSRSHGFFRVAALYNTPYPILGLNHPTDDPNPTKAEREKIEQML